MTIISIIFRYVEMDEAVLVWLLRLPNSHSSLKTRTNGGCCILYASSPSSKLSTGLQLSKMRVLGDDDEGNNTTAPGHACPQPHACNQHRACMPTLQV